MRSPIQRVCIVAALVLSLGLHWTVLQSAAWVGMMVSYSRGGSIGKALEKTFSGEHPCSLCNLVKVGAASDEDKDEQQGTSTTIKKLDLTLQCIERVILVPPSKPEYASLEVRATARASVPAVPPPRAA